MGDIRNIDEVFREIEIQVRPDRIRGQLGYPPEASVAPQMSERIDGEISRSLPLVRAAGMFRVFGITSLERRSISLEGGITFRGAIGEYLGDIEGLAVFIATAGEEIYRKAQEDLKAGRVLEGMVANAVGSEAADSATESLRTRIREMAAAEGLAITLPYSPGYCGMKLEEQKNVFSALDGSRIGVRLLSSGIMIPIKSVSGVIGIGSPAAVGEDGSACDRCDREDCNMRRYAS